MSKTLDKIFLSTAQKYADDVAITDCPGNARLGLGTINELTYNQAQRYITQTASFFRELGFKDGDVILTQLPNIAETPLILLSIINAGLIPCLLPTHWRSKEIKQAIHSLKPKAVLAHQSVPDYDPFTTMMEIASEQMSLRYIFGLHDNLPDGITPLPNLLQTIAVATQATEDDDTIYRRGGEQVAFIGWTHDEEGTPHPVAYTHIQLMANAHFISERLNQSGTVITQPSILTPYSPTTLHGLITAFIPWVMEGGTLHITSSLNIDQTAVRILESNVNRVLFPEALGTKLNAALTELGLSASELPNLALIATTPTNANNYTGANQQDSSATIYNLNGLCLMASSAKQNSRAILQLGHQTAPNEQPLTPPFIETRLSGGPQKAGDDQDVMSGRLELNGTAIGFSNWQEDMTTAPLSNFDEHWEKTYLTASVFDEAMSSLKIESNENTIYYGNSQLSGPELDQLYQAYPGFVDAAAFSIKDPLLGERLFAAIIPNPGDALSFDDFKDYLKAQNISPAKIPEKLVTVSEIPRGQDGLIVRHAIFSHP